MTPDQDGGEGAEDGRAPEREGDRAPRIGDRPVTVSLPELCLVVLVGPSGSGKSTFARRHFLPTEVISSDFCRGLVSDDENDQSVTAAAFELVHTIAGKRLEAGRLAVVDATSVRPEDRRPLVELARRHHVFPVAVVLDLSYALCLRRNESRPDRAFGPHVIRNQQTALRRSVRGLRREGFKRVVVLRSEQQVAGAAVVRERLWTDRRDLTGPFDIIGDVHGCHTELVALLSRLGWQVDPDGTDAVHPEGRMAVFLGDLVDRGPQTPAVLRLAMNLDRAGRALCLPGNHENKLQRALAGRNVQLTHGLDRSLEQLAAEPPELGPEVARWIDGLVSHAVLDGGALVVAHAGLPQAMHGRASGAVRSFALYGDTTGETDDYGLPVRYPWAEDYRGRAAVVYGHTPVPEAEWVNGTICIDTGCVFGGSLTALRWPERTLVSVPAAEVYYQPTNPGAATAVAAPAGKAAAGAGGPDPERGQDLDLADVTGKRIIETRFGRTITVRAESAAAALEVMSRFAVDPRWLLYLPPTMAPPATSSLAGLLEHPVEAFEAYAAEGVEAVVCEEKHMGSRAVVVVCADPDTALRRFGVAGNPAAGSVHTRTGRAFFSQPDHEIALLDRVRATVERAGLWSELATDWLALDCELLPWSAKAGDLLRTQYAAVGAAATTALEAESALLEAAAARLTEVAPLARQANDRLDAARRFVAAYRRYCWPVDGLEGLALAPFQVLAGEGAVHALRPHPWHLDIGRRLAAADPVLFRPTASYDVDLHDPASVAAATRWWEELTAAGGEGMVVKPREVVVGDGHRLVQPGIKCRGPEYLRLVYGPEYALESQLERLRARSLGHKRSLATREYLLGLEGLERFVAGEGLHRVHECVFGVLAMESEPVDPRL